MVFSNLASYWCRDPMAMFKNFAEYSRPDGMLLISTLGPETMAELRHAWSGVDPQVELPVFPDLLEIGDALMSAGFREPVMDMERNYAELSTAWMLCSMSSRQPECQCWSGMGA